jgi:hypothetical protein
MLENNNHGLTYEEMQVYVLLSDKFYTELKAGELHKWREMGK